MATIRSGVLGNTRGKVGGIVASQWKDKNYIREYVKPGNPRTAAQLAQRSKMALAVEFSKPLVGPVFNKFLDPFLKSVSGFNSFISTNIAKFVDPVPYTNVQVVTGKLLPLSSLIISSAPGVDLMVIEWNLGSIPAELITQPVEIVVYNATQKVWFFSLNGNEIGDEEQTVNVTGREITDTMVVYAWYGQEINDVLRGVSTSVSVSEN